MSDLCKCLGIDCPIKKACLRHMGDSHSPMQSFFVEPPFDPDTGDCEYFLPIKEKEQENGKQ